MPGGQTTLPSRPVRDSARRTAPAVCGELLSLSSRRPTGGEPKEGEGDALRIRAVVFLDWLIASPHPTRAQPILYARTAIGWREDSRWPLSAVSWQRADRRRGLRSIGPGGPHRHCCTGWCRGHLETYLAASRAAEDADSEAMPRFVEREFRRYLECASSPTALREPDARSAATTS